MSYVSARSVELDEERGDLYFDPERNSYRPLTTWTAALVDAKIHPYGRINMSRTGDTAKEATENLKAAVIEQGYDWREA